MPPSSSMTAPTTPAGSRRRTPSRFKTRSKPRYPSSPVIRWWQSARGAPTPVFTHSGKSFISIRRRSVRPGRGSWARIRGSRPAIALQWAGEVSMGFHARHKASRRIYRYVILNRSARSALQRARTAWIHRPLDARGHACGRSGAHRRARFLGVPIHSMPVADPGQACRCHRGDSRGRPGIAADHRQCLPASHGPQYCRHLARCAAAGRS